jgi:hypothetical protein
MAVGNFSLDHAGPQLSLRAVVGGLDLAGIIAKDQKLILRPPDFGLQLACEVAFCRCGKKGGELLFKLALFAGDCRGGETGDISGQIEGLAKPQLEPQGQIVRSVLQRIGRVARQMRQTGLMCGAMLLLRGVTIRNPDVRRMAVHRLCHDTGGTRIIGLMHHGVLAMEPSASNRRAEFKSTPNESSSNVLLSRSASTANPIKFHDSVELEGGPFRPHSLDGASIWGTTVAILKIINMLIWV